MDDERFKGISTDPRFRTLPSRFRKVKIDKRFQGMFTDKKFKIKTSVDERGRPIKLTSNQHLKKFYDLSSSDEDDGEDKVDESDEESVSGDKIEAADGESQSLKTKIEKDQKTVKKTLESSDISEDEVSEADEEEEDEEEVDRLEIKPELDYARGQVMQSSSSEESDSDDDEHAVPYDQEAHDDHYWGEQDNEAAMTEEATKRLAIMNMDWDRVKAVDLLLVMNSFKPTSGTVYSVKIYPSEYGKEKMKEDDVSGPKELKNINLDEDGEGTGKIANLGEKDQEKVLLENLRQYQLNRLKYYYAVAECDSAETADHIYTNCDGQEYLASCTEIDLRFIPDDMEFNEDEVKEAATHVPDNYIPRIFINNAKGQSLVTCTWDETAPDRYDTLNKMYKKDEIDDLDLQAYLASATSSNESEDDVAEEETNKKTSKRKKKKNSVKSEPAASSSKDTAPTDLVSDSGSGEDEEAIAKYRQLLLGGTADIDKEQSEEDDIDMEVTWDTGLKDAAEELVSKSKKKRGEKELTVFERQLEKKKEKKLSRKKEKKAAAVEVSNNMESEEKLTSKKNKKSKRLDEQKADDSDELQSELAFSDDDVPDGFDASEFGLSKSDPLLKSSKAKGKKNKKSTKKMSDDEAEDMGAEDNAEQKADLSLMLMDDAGESKKKHFNMKEIVEYDNMTKSKKKRKMKKNQLKDIQDDFEIDVADDRFSALYTSHLFNIDPSSQDYRKTKSMEAIVNEKQRRIQSNERKLDTGVKRKMENKSSKDDPTKKLSQKSTKGINKAELSNLVKSVKAKSQQLNAKQNKRMKVS